MDIKDSIYKAFDINDQNILNHEVQDLPDLPKNFRILLIVGSSGGGKTSMIKKHFNYEGQVFDWNSRPDEPICNFFETADDAINRLGAVGLNSIPSWLKPYRVLSNGEKFRADLAINLRSGAVFDEFTSVVDRNVAKSTSVSISKYINKNDLQNVVFASCHRDIIRWLEPDFVYDVDSQQLEDRRSLRSRPDITICIRELAREEKDEVWRIFRKHHYLDTKLNKSARCFVAYWKDILIGFTSVLAMPSGSLKNAYRGHRTVILPDFQGMGIGTKLSDFIGQLHLEEGKRYFSRTSHFRFGEYRERSKLWRATSKNKVLRKRYTYQT